MICGDFPKPANALTDQTQACMPEVIGSSCQGCTSTGSHAAGIHLPMLSAMVLSVESRGIYLKLADDAHALRMNERGMGFGPQ